MNFNVDRIAQLAGLAGSASGSGAPRALTESARSTRAPTTYDRVVEELQVRGLEMFYTPEQINETIRSERRMLAEERAMENEGMCSKCGKRRCMCESADEGMGHSMGHEYEGMGHGMGHDDEEELMELLDQHGEEEDEGYAVGTTITEPDGTAYKVTSAGKTSSAMAETKLRRAISLEVDRVLAEMSNSGDTSWMYPNGKRPTGSSRSRTTLGFAGNGFKR